MEPVRVSDGRMHTDGRPEARGSGAGQRLPQAPGGIREQRARGDDETGREEAASKPGAVMRDKRHEPGIGRVELRDTHPHELEILGYEDSSHTDRENRGPGEPHSYTGRQEREPPDSLTALETTKDKSGAGARCAP